MMTRKPHPDCVEYILEDGSRYAWSESNTQYELVPEDGTSFTLLRTRLSRLEEAVKALYDVPTSTQQWWEAWTHLKRMI